MLARVQRFGAASNQPFLDRGSVRRRVWSIFSEFAKRRGERPGKRKSRELERDGLRI
jgi:hypothetical protein